MNGNTLPILFPLLRSAISGETLTEIEISAYNEELLPELFSTAKKHDVAPILAAGLEQNGLPGVALVENELFKAVFRYEQLKYDLEKLCNALEEAKIPFIPLKGSVIRKYYRVPWMRTSCDIDVLLKEEDMDRAVEYLTEQLDYTNTDKTTHEVSLFTSNKVHIELHYDLVEDGFANDASTILKGVWSRCKLKKGYSFWYETTDEMFYFYHIAHMVKHFEIGGCGIRPLIDLWILDHIEEADQVKRDELLRSANLLKFTEAARKLSRVWFEQEEIDDITQKMQNYIISGGVYGSSENRVAIQQRKKGGKIGYVFSRLFIPYSRLKRYYPILEKHRWLTPVMQVRRWFMLFKPDVARMAKSELAVNKELEKSTADDMNVFLHEIGIG